MVTSFKSEFVDNDGRNNGMDDRKPSALTIRLGLDHLSQRATNGRNNIANRPAPPTAASVSSHNISTQSRAAVANRHHHESHHNAQTGNHNFRTIPHSTSPSLLAATIVDRSILTNEPLHLGESYQRMPPPPPATTTRPPTKTRAIRYSHFAMQPTPPTANNSLITAQSLDLRKIDSFRDRKRKSGVYFEDQEIDVPYQHYISGQTITAAMPVPVPDVGKPLLAPPNLASSKPRKEAMVPPIRPELILINHPAKKHKQPILHGFDSSRESIIPGTDYNMLSSRGHHNTNINTASIQTNVVGVNYARDAKSRRMSEDESAFIEATAQLFNYSRKK